MNHETCRERLVELAYGELTRKQSAELERHLADCEPCRRERDRLGETIGAMRRLEAPPVPQRDDALVLAAARQAAEERRRDSFGRALRSFSLRIAAGTAFAALAVFLVVQVRQGLRPPTEDVARERAAAPGEPAPAAPALSSAPAETARPFAAGREAPRSTAEAGPPPRERGQAAPAEKKRAAKKREGVDRTGESAFAQPPPGGEAAPSAKAAPGRRDGPSVAADASPEREAQSIGAPRPPSPAGPGQARAADAETARVERLRSEAVAPAAPMPSRAPAAARRSATGAPSGPTTAWARTVEARHAAGELSEAQKRFEPCPGGDVRRVAWIDGAQRVLKLVRERTDGAMVEEWFDEDGRLREALVRARVTGGLWTRHVRVGDRGDETQDASDTGLAPETPPPPLVRRDPSVAFFSGAGCEPPKSP